MNTPKISVVVPAFNVENYIECAVDSLLGQTVPFYEIIVVDDGSTDRTGEKLQAYARHPLVRVVRTRNQGLGAARNEGIVRASGDYIYFFDADDFLDAGFVSRIHAELHKTPELELIFFSGEVFYDEDLDTTHYAQVDMDEFRRQFAATFANGIDAAGAMMERGRFTPSACLYVSRLGIWAHGLRFKSVLHEDEEIIMRLCAAARATRIIGASLFWRRLRNNSLMTAQCSPQHVRGYFSAFTSTARLTASIINAGHRRVVQHRLRELAWLYMNECRRAGVNPKALDLMYMLATARHLPVRDFWRLFIPVTVRGRLKTLKAGCAELGLRLKRNS